MRAYRKIFIAAVILMMAVVLSSCTGEIAGSSLWELAVAAGIPADTADGYFERPQNFDVTVPQSGEPRFTHTGSNAESLQKQQVTSKGYIIEEIDGVTYVGGILIANKTYIVPKSYNPGGLTDECSAAFSAMRSAAAKDGINLFIASGFRSYSSQTSIYWNYVAKRGMETADTFSARPGHSEHQTGLAMDLNSISDSFGETAEGMWLATHAHEYGFILRYPKGKSDITGYKYEPWHFRYIGVDMAKEVYDSGLTLEEFLGIDSVYSIASAFEEYGRN
ncbi:MAG: M15 family metallopeptidase [Oscillospiraceae bacterium]|nr:M15 family metallopeptidase [Oscillospiraceae bacterium]